MRESNQAEYPSLDCMEFFFSHICLVVIVLFGKLCYISLLPGFDRFGKFNSFDFIYI